MSNRRSWVAGIVVLAGHFGARAQITNPLPEPVDKRGLMVEVPARFDGQPANFTFRPLVRTFERIRPHGNSMDWRIV